MQWYSVLNARNASNKCSGALRCLGVAWSNQTVYWSSTNETLWEYLDMVTTRYLVLPAAMYVHLA